MVQILESDIIKKYNLILSYKKDEYIFFCMTDIKIIFLEMKIEKKKKCESS